MKKCKFATTLFVGLILAVGFLVGMTPASVVADVPPVTPTIPGTGVTDVSCETDTDCIFLNYRWNTNVHPCCLYDNEGEEINRLCERCWEKYFRRHWCSLPEHLCKYEDQHQTNFIRFPCYQCPEGTTCCDDTCLPEPKSEGPPAYVSVAIHGMVLIEDQCHEVGLVGVGVRLTGGDLPMRQTGGQDGEAHWEFYPGWGIGTHTVEVWDGVRWVSLVPMGSSKLIVFRGSELRAGQTLDLGSHIWWAQCP